MGNLLNYTPFLWSSFLIGGLSLIGIPYFSGYFYKTYLINNLLENNSFFCGFEFILILSYYFTIFYICRVGYIVFFSGKNGHKILYKLKNLSIYFYFNLFVLCYIICCSFDFWKSIVDVNYFILIDNYFNNIISKHNPNLNNLLYLPGNIWSYIYAFIVLTLFIYLFVTFNLNWSFLQFWYFMLTILYIIFLLLVF
jgi:NADH:ubiquinone oxidoreductase subunit 5 (subunit L)/multisubunit Na+/H+ antiporter MnhA subunit